MPSVALRARTLRAFARHSTNVSLPDHRITLIQTDVIVC